MDAFNLDPAKLSSTTAVAQASAAIQQAAAIRGVQVGAVRESPSRSASKELASVQLEAMGQVPAITTFLNRLESVGYPVIKAENGAEAMCCIDREKPRLIVLDMHMPLMAGRDLAAYARNRGCDAPILVMTASIEAQQAADAIDADGYIAKPFELSDLISTVDRLCA